MKTVGELLRTARIKKRLNIATVAERTKIQSKFIKALEANDYPKLPESTFVKGFIRNYAQVIDKNPQVLLAIFRRDYGEDIKGKVIPRGLVDPLNQPRLRWTPQATMIATFTFIVTLFIAYLIIQFRFLSGIPKLTLKTPQENALVSALVTIEGFTSPQATITINNQAVEVQENGYFTETISLTSGQHTITIEAKSRTNKITTLQRTVIVDSSNH